MHDRVGRDLTILRQGVVVVQVDWLRLRGLRLRLRLRLQLLLWLLLFPWAIPAEVGPSS